MEVCASSVRSLRPLHTPQCTDARGKSKSSCLRVHLLPLLLDGPYGGEKSILAWEKLRQGTELSAKRPFPPALASCSYSCACSPAPWAVAAALAVAWFVAWAEAWACAAAARSVREASGPAASTSEAKGPGTGDVRSSCGLPCSAAWPWSTRRAK